MAALTPAQEVLIRESFDAIRPLAGPLSTLFYGRLFSYAPDLRPMFKGGIREQGEKLMAMVSACVDGLGRMDELRPQLRELGQRHVAYGTLPEHYPVVGKALLWSLGQALEYRFDAPTKEAWTALLDEICREMLAGAAETPSA
jgi:hemoglobin-like flavoprotein